MSGADRISSLPDPLLHHILSLLKTKEAVSTHVLSKHWKDIWTYVPTLKFYSDQFRDESEFEHFLNFVFEHWQTMSLDTFELRWQHCASTFEAAERWLSHVVKCEPRVVILVTSGINQHLDFADYVFTCESLEELTLSTYIKRGGDPYAVKPKSVNLKRLKRLDISCGLNLDDDFMEQLMLGSPVLEELRLRCCYEGLTIIESETLKHLDISWEISRCYSSYYEDDYEGIEISIPGLVSLYIEYGVPGRLSCDNLESLVDAYVHVDDIFYDSDVTLLSGFSNATELCFYNLQAMEMFEQELPICPIFNNLKEMTCQISSFYPIAWFLQHAPNLEKLTLQYYGKCNSKFEEQNYEGRDVSFSCKKLKMLEIYYSDVEEVQDAVNLLSYNKDLPDDIEVNLLRS